MRKHSIILLFLVGVIGVIAALLVLLFDIESRPILAGATAVIGESNAPAGAQAFPSDAETRGARSAIQVSDAGVDGPSGRDVEIESPDALTAAKSQAVVVRRAHSREPVPNAVVHAYPVRPGSIDAARIEHWLRESSLEASLPVTSTPTRTDSEGVATFPYDEKGVVVIATADDLWGYALSQARDPSPLCVEVAHDTQVRVDVVDAQENPVPGARVALRLGYEDDLESLSDCLFATSPQDSGSALLRHVEHFLRLDFDAPEDFNAVFISSAGVLPNHEPVSLDRDAIPADVRLVVPATGSCEIRVVDRSGDPFTAPVDIRLCATADDDDVDEPASSTRSGVTGGSALFPNIALGLDLIAYVSGEGSSVEHVGRGPGPRVAGGRAVITVSLGAQTATIAARLQTIDGVPIAESAVLVREVRARSTESSRTATMDLGRVHTNAQGEFQVDLPPRRETPRSLKVTLLDAKGDEVGKGTTLLNSVLALDSVTHLGDIVIERPPFLASGVVVDVHGQRVAHAVVRGELSDAHGNTRPLSTGTRTDQTGAFELRAECGAGSLRLKAQKAELLGSCDINRGAVDVEVVLAPAGELRGIVNFSAAIPARGWIATAWGSNTYVSRTLDDDGRFTLTGLAPGTYDVWIGSTTKKWWWYSEGLLVQPGSNAPHELNPVDLRGLRRIELSIQDHLNSPIEAGTVSKTSGGETNSQTFARGRATILSDVTLDVAIRSPGYLIERRSNVFDSKTIKLVRGPELVFKLAAGLPIPSAPEYLSLQLAQDAESVGLWDYWSLVFGPDGTARCPAPFLGTLHTSFALHGEGWRQSAVIDGAQITVARDGESSQPIEVRFDVSAYEEALTMIRGND